MDEPDPGDFVRRFTQWWHAPDLTTMDQLLSPDVVLVAPLIPKTVGLERGRRAFGRLFKAVPDLAGVIHGWAATDSGDRIYIELSLFGTLGGKPICWENVDRITLGPDGLATERVNFHDSMDVVGQILLSPRGWPQVVRSGVLWPRVR